MLNNSNSSTSTSSKRRPSTSSSPSSLNSSISNNIVPPSVSPSLKSQRLILPKPLSGSSSSSSSNNNNNNNNNNILSSTNNDIILSELSTHSQGRQGRIKDVQTIIADYRSKNLTSTPVTVVPDIQTHQVPKVRGRRSSTNSSRSSSSHSSSNILGDTSRFSNPSLLSMANLALGSGATIRQPGGHQQSLSQASFLNASPEIQLNLLAGLQNRSQSKPQSMPQPSVAQPTFPEVTLHPVLPSPTQQQNSLLHGILTKTNSGKQSSQQPAMNARSSSFSPTLARLLTAPERNRLAAGGHVNTGGNNFPASNMLRGQQKMRSNQPCSNDIVASLKQKIVPQQSRHQQQVVQQQQQQQAAAQAQSEITITPVTQPQSVVNLVEDEDEADRLVIDETPRTGSNTSGTNNNSGSNASSSNSGANQQTEQIPECQGCHRNSAQFVCAGCGNQWYCSRECQVTAWEEHSDVCSG